MKYHIKIPVQIESRIRENTILYMEDFVPISDFPDYFINKLGQILSKRQCKKVE